MRRAVATSATLNVTHAAANPVAEMVDIYLTTSVGIEGSDPTITNFAYKESAKGLYVAAGTYYVTVTVAGNPAAVAIDSLPVDLMNGVVYQVVAIDDGTMVASIFSLMTSPIRKKGGESLPIVKADYDE